jgi:hypothetical protein
LGGIDVAKRLNPITFAWKDDGRCDIGFGAEEVAKVEPLLTFNNDKGELEGSLLTQRELFAQSIVAAIQWAVLVGGI